MIGSVLSAEHISHSFGDHRVLDDICFSVQSGEIFGLLGPSGAGKTTLIRILTGQLRQTSGDARLLGTDTRHLTEREYLRIGSMMDCLGLYERLSAQDNLRFFAQIFGLPESCAAGALTEVGLLKARKTAVEHLSKGMKNRLSLARALMNRPEILFLDEPTGGLDPASTRAIHALLQKRRQEGTAIFLTTHDMHEAETLCDTVALLCEGHIVETGTPGDICRRHNHLGGLAITCRDGTRLTLANAPSSAEKVSRLLARDDIESIHSTEPNLETVFLELTGTNLESAEEA